MSSSSRCAAPERRALLAAGLAAAWPAAWAQAALPAELMRSLPGAVLRGSARLRFLGLHIYDARLWAPAPVGAARWAQQAFALELEYARAFTGAKIAGRSVDEMLRQAPEDGAQAERWRADLSRLFPDVDAGDRLSGIHQPGEPARFFHNGRPRGELRDPEVARRFFAIWLAPTTSEPAMRTRLLGLDSAQAAR